MRLEAGFVRLKVAGVSERLAMMYLGGEGQVVNQTEGSVSQAPVVEVPWARQIYKER
jgi:hypothetical protein